MYEIQQVDYFFKKLLVPGWPLFSTTDPEQQQQQQKLGGIY